MGAGVCFFLVKTAVNVLLLLCRFLFVLRDKGIEFLFKWNKRHAYDYWSPRDGS